MSTPATTLSDHIQTHRIFGLLPAQGQRRLAEAITVHRLDAGDTLDLAGDPNPALQWLVSGDAGAAGRPSPADADPACRRTAGAHRPPGYCLGAGANALRARAARRQPGRVAARRVGGTGDPAAACASSVARQVARTQPDRPGPQPHDHAGARADQARARDAAAPHTYQRGGPRHEREAGVFGADRGAGTPVRSGHRPGPAQPCAGRRAGRDAAGGRHCHAGADDDRRAEPGVRRPAADGPPQHPPCAGARRSEASWA